MTEYTHAQDGRTLEVFSVLTMTKPGCAGISVSPDLFVHVSSDKVEEVCAALREAAGLPPVWTVEKVAHDEACGETINANNGIDSAPVTYSLNPEGARGYAAQLLAAADEAEARANRPQLPTATRTMVQAGGYAWVRSDNDRWTPVETRGHLVGMNDRAMSAADFTVLYDPEKAS